MYVENTLDGVFSMIDGIDQKTAECIIQFNHSIDVAEFEWLACPTGELYIYKVNENLFYCFCSTMGGSNLGVYRIPQQRFIDEMQDIGCEIDFSKIW